MTADRSQAERFISILTRSISERVTVQVLPEGSSSIFPNILHGSLEGLWDELEWLNGRGAGLFVLVSAGDGRGRSAGNVTHIRSVFLDLDGAPLPSRYALEPHLVVESSPGRFHVYWLVSGVPLDDFGVLQRTLAKLYDGDPAVSDLPRAMRLPGFFHRKAEPVMAQLVKVSDHPRYDYATILEVWPELGNALIAREQARVEAEACRQRARLNPLTASTERVQRLLQSHHNAIADAPEGTRHGVLLRHARVLGGYVGSGTVTLEDATEALTAAAVAAGLPEAEAAAAVRWGLERGQTEPLYLSAFDVTASFGANALASNNPRLAGDKPLLMQSCRDSRGLGAKPILGGRPCL